MSTPLYKAGDRVSVVQGRHAGKAGTLVRVGTTLSLMRFSGAKGDTPVFNVNLAKLDNDKSKVNDGVLTTALVAALLLKLWNWYTRQPDKSGGIYVRRS